jgi:hypothetical protein
MRKERGIGNKGRFNQAKNTKLEDLIQLVLLFLYIST